MVPGDGGIGDIYHYINDRFDYHQRVYKVVILVIVFVGNSFITAWCKICNHALRNSVLR